MRKDKELDAEQFYTLAQDPEFGDEMIFVLENVNPENKATFSKEGVEGITDQVHDFLIARTLAQWKKTGKPPKKVGIGITLVWDEEVGDPALQPIPWYRGESETPTGLSLVDGEHRIPRKRLDE